MKTNFFKSGLFLTGVASLSLSLSLSLSGCSKGQEKKSDIVDEKTQVAFDDLSVRLDALNADFVQQSITRGYTPQETTYEDPGVTFDEDASRARGRWGRIVAADASGGLVGVGCGSVGGPALMGFLGLLFAIMTSITYAAAAEVEFQVAPLTPGNYLEQVVSPNDFDKMGCYHNVVIKNITDEFGYEFLKQADVNTIYNAVENELKELGYDSSYHSGVSAQYKSQIIDFSNAVKSGNVDRITNVVAEKNPAMANEIAIARSYLTAGSNIDPTLIEEYSASFSNIVSSSTIPVESKYALQSTVSVATGSSMLWTIK